MKSFLSILPILFLAFTTLVSQSFTSERLKVLSWNKNSTLTLTADYGDGEIKMASLNRRVKGTKTWERLARLNNEYFTLKKESGALNVVNEFGETVLVTKRDRRMAFVDGKQYQRKMRVGIINFSVSYEDEDGEVIVKGMMYDRKLRIKLYAQEDLAGQYLLLAALDDLMRMFRDNRSLQLGLSYG